MFTRMARMGANSWRTGWAGHSGRVFKELTALFGGFWRLLALFGARVWAARAAPSAGEMTGDDQT
jgi:hypothetical protein